MSKACCAAAATCRSKKEEPLAWFSHMIENCYAAAVAAKKRGLPVVGIMCEYTPRELIMAAGGLPVCLCGGSVDTIASAESILPSNLCPLIKSTFGYHVERSNPFLEMADLVVADTTCDGKKKMYELMGQSRPMCILELPQKPNEAEALSHWRGELEKLKHELERRFHVSITDKRLRAAIVIMNGERALRRKLAELMRARNPPLTGLELLSLKSSISGLPEDLAQYAAALVSLPRRAKKTPKNKRVRVLLTGVPMPHGAERVLELIEGNGGLAVCSENCTGIKPIREDVDPNAPDLLQALAAKYLHLPCSVMTPNDRRMELLKELVGEYHPQCIIELIWQACLTYDVESARVRQLAESLKLPYLRIETDYAPSDSARIAMRIQALFETIHRL